MQIRWLALGAAFCLLLAAVPAAGTTVGDDAGEGGEEAAGFWGRLDFDWYGYVKLDLAYDGSQTAPGEFAKWAVPEPDDGDELSLTLNQTRMGLRVRGDEEARVRGGARVEIDFYGHVDDPDPRIRHAYFEVGWPEAEFDIIVGQTSDVISPLFPSTLNYTVAWFAGNIGFRRPQIRATKRFEAGGEGEIRVEGALTHNIYDTRVGSVSGEDEGLAVQARVAYSFPAGGPAPVTIGLSGHRAEETFPHDGGPTSCDSWSANLDLSVPIDSSVRLQTELWSGLSLGPYLGGAGQGVAVDDALGLHGVRGLHGIRSRGGWLALNIAGKERRPRFNFGFSIDDVDGDDLAPGGRELNRSVFGNVVFSLKRQIDLGFELSHWTTKYKDSGECDALRSQVSLIYRI
ncbi:MAG: hypothetical protein GY719_33840 [bacterium]|nr:hypothetical protein [bacterium]